MLKQFSTSLYLLWTIFTLLLNIIHLYYNTLVVPLFNISYSNSHIFLNFFLLRFFYRLLFFLSQCCCYFFFLFFLSSLCLFLSFKNTIDIDEAHHKEVKENQTKYDNLALVGLNTTQVLWSIDWLIGRVVSSFIWNACWIIRHINKINNNQEMPIAVTEVSKIILFVLLWSFFGFIYLDPRWLEIIFA